MFGIHLIVIKKYCHYSSNKPVAERDNILNQDFKATGINQKWCTDITYIYTRKDGWTYLASVMDLYSRKIIGWAYNNACIESWYNLQRTHSSLGYKTPAGVHAEGAV